MEKEWRMHAFRADFNQIAKEHGISPVTARVLVNRGLTTKEEIASFLHAGYEMTHDPFLMADMEKACAIMAEKLRAGAHIRIISDYDVDGVMSNYILLKGLTIGDGGEGSFLAAGDGGEGSILTLHPRPRWTYGCD